MSDDVDCGCGGHGYHELRAVEGVNPHDKRPGTSTKRLVTFLAPCDCDDGATWAALPDDERRALTRGAR